MSLSREHRAKISASLKGRKRPPEVRAKISAGRRGIPNSPEQKAKISKALKGRKASAARHMNSRIAERVIKLFNPEAYRAKQERARRQMAKNWQDPAFRAAFSATQKVRWERYREAKATGRANIPHHEEREAA